jgi:hypothetical protein
MTLSGIARVPNHSPDSLHRDTADGTATAANDTVRRSRRSETT